MKINKVYIKREETREQLREEAANMPFPALQACLCLRNRSVPSSLAVFRRQAERQAIQECVPSGREA
jgi:hypothetical protein